MKGTLYMITTLVVMSTILHQLSAHLCIGRELNQLTGHLQRNENKIKSQSKRAKTISFLKKKLRLTRVNHEFL